MKRTETEKNADAHEIDPLREGCLAQALGIKRVFYRVIDTTAAYCRESGLR